MKHISILAAASFLVALSAVPAVAGDCTGNVVGVRPVSQYNHANGAGFLAVRNGPGGGYRQTGELYSGDEVAVWNKKGGWYQIACMSGRCTNPLWGQPNPRGWVSAKYVRAGGICPR